MYKNNTTLSKRRLNPLFLVQEVEQDIPDVEKASAPPSPEDEARQADACSEYELRRGGLIFALCALRHIAFATLVRCAHYLMFFAEMCTHDNFVVSVIRMRGRVSC